MEWAHRDHTSRQLYVSDAIFVEDRAVLARQELRIRKDSSGSFKSSGNARIPFYFPLTAGDEDPDDNKFLQCADAARADYLATGNQRHFPSFWKGTKVITSREFISIVAPHLIREKSSYPRISAFASNSLRKYYFRI